MQDLGRRGLNASGEKASVVYGSYGALPEAAFVDGVDGSRATRCSVAESAGILHRCDGVQ
jgi:hypothetical protein